MVATIFNESVDPVTFELPISHGGGTSAPAPADGQRQVDELLISCTRSSLGRKFDFTDVEKHADLYAAAVRYLHRYTGSFAFLADMKRQRRKISEKQAAGVLNCMVAEINRNAPKPEPTPRPGLDEDDRSYEAWLDYQASAVGKGTYAVILPMVSDRVTVRLGPWRADKYNQGKKMRWITVRQGHEYVLYARQNEGQQHRVMPKMRGSNGRWNSAISALLGDENVAAEAALAYAIESGRCARCDRELTVPASIHQGFGPECIKYVKGA
jgi:hypothetical protein